MKKIKAYIKLMRMHHYIKNGLIFAAVACSGQLFQKKKFLAGVMGFLAFCTVSSLIYIVNDICDREKDRRHPTKCNRPIASGMVSITGVWILVVILTFCALMFNASVFHLNSSLLLLLYLVLNLAYSFGLKNIPLVDVTILSTGFLIRTLYGAIITEITVSGWLYLTVITFAFYFSLGKRRNEIQHICGRETRKVLQFYPTSFLDKNMYMCLALANTFYALWCMDDHTTQLYGGTNLMFTVPVMLLITMRYSMDIEGNSDGDPVEVVLHDKSLLILCTVHLTIMFTILYFSNRN